ncbi:hypothetical protein KH5H1_13290 [Corallococcus caeni]|uniref:DUF2378 family protein n=1 Tax=Corallococcus exercitus TaxID=2316736 RepID=A0A7Y4JSW4_9BACT|nr:DUF2378 family protein [Corallococcus exercitus]NOK10550.1 DUF2378 family protein [Corallococcus exercitus]GMT97210.1 hypothetical protein KH5H1_13290 [Corallococcus sp. KH5-1]
MSLPLDDLEQRIALTRPGDTVRGLSFAAVLRLTHERLGRDAAERLRAPLMQRSPVDFFSYPAVDFLRLIGFASEALQPGYGTREAALRACGEAIVGTFFESTVGQTLLRLTAGAGDPKRMYSNAPASYGTAVSYGQREYLALGDKRVRLTFKGDLLPVQVHEGILGGVLTALHREGHVRGTERGLGDSEFLIEWA